MLSQERIKLLTSQCREGKYSMSIGDALMATLAYFITLSVLQLRLSLLVLAYNAHKFSPSMDSINQFCRNIGSLRRRLYQTQLEVDLKDYIVQGKRNDNLLGIVGLSALIFSFFGVLSFVALRGGLNSGQLLLSSVGVLWMGWLLISMWFCSRTGVSLSAK